MPRRRLAVAVLLPPPVHEEVEVLRRALDDPARHRIAPHVTIIPPMNLRGETVDAALHAVREVGGAAAPFTARLGPIATFAPTSPVLHLAVGPADAVAALDSLRTRLRTGPWGRPERHPFVPHVTVHDRADEALVAAGSRALAGYQATLVVTALTVLEQVVDASGRRWTPLDDVLLGGVTARSWGADRLQVTVGTVLAPDVVAAVGGAVDPGAPAGPIGGGPPAPGPGALVATGRAGGQVVGAVIVRPDRSTAPGGGEASWTATWTWTRHDDPDLVRELLACAQRHGRPVTTPRATP